MKYLIIGTGGTGGAIGGFLAADGRDVTFIARGAHLEAMRQNGLRVRSDLRGDLCIEHPKVVEMEDYDDTPDVVFVCVKGYSLDAAERLLARVATERTVVIPILNVYGTGGEMQRRLPKLHILDGCIYIMALISAPGEITQTGKNFRVIFGERDGSHPAALDAIAAEMTASGIRVVVSDNVRRDCFEKFACVSPMAAAGAYYDVTVDVLRADEAMRRDYFALTAEVDALAKGMGMPFEADVMAKNERMLEGYAVGATASMQRDLKKGGSSELDGLVFEPVRLGRRYGVPTPVYEKIARHFGFSE